MNVPLFLRRLARLRIVIHIKKTHFFLGMDTQFDYYLFANNNFNNCFLVMFLSHFLCK
jgi:hypothetical protein